MKRAEGKKRAPTTRVVKGSDTFVTSVSSPPPSNSSPVVLLSQGTGQKSQRVDREFFATNSPLGGRVFLANGQEFNRDKSYPHQNAVADDGTPLDGRRARIASALASAGVEGHIVPGKKHHKKMKRAKHRSGKGYD